MAAMAPAALPNSQPTRYAPAASAAAVQSIAPPSPREQARPLEFSMAELGSQAKVVSFAPQHRLRASGLAQKAWRLRAAALESDSGLPCLNRPWPCHAA